uniref:BPTI/Kunitz inhibitor domain-containing protein n=1 Tax=Neolamprologus brichardi TaxID=32507 RepID=A0A3Q4GL77_NEOBR
MLASFLNASLPPPESPPAGHQKECRRSVGLCWSPCLFVVNVCVLLSARCQLPADIGNQCKKYATAWFFDTNVGACSRFWYGGCGGNANRFRTEYECFQTCGNQRKSRLHTNCPLHVCSEREGKRRSYFPVVLTRTSVHVEMFLISVSFCPPDSCVLPQDQGSCDNYTMMWFFDAAQKECARFWYGGCGGNKNRFLTQEECQKPRKFTHNALFRVLSAELSNYKRP